VRHAVYTPLLILLLVGMTACGDLGITTTDGTGDTGGSGSSGGQAVSGGEGFL
jgi:hypothetical protein